MQSDSSDVRNLVATLTPLIKKCNKMVTNDVRSAMFGFQGMHSSSKEVNEFIGTFAGTYVCILHFSYQSILLLFFYDNCISIYFFFCILIDMVFSHFQSYYYSFNSHYCFFSNLLLDLYERSDVHFTSAYDASTVLYSMQGTNSVMWCVMEWERI
jgi:hypothetical protein